MVDTTITVKEKFIAPPADQWDRTKDRERTSFKQLTIHMEGETQIYSKIFKKLEEMANGNGWILE